MKPPICPRCPNCGNRQYHAVQPAEFLTFSKDRLCLACNTRYAPPTPLWATIVFILIGGLLCVGCGLSVVIVLIRGMPAALPTNLAFFALGVFCIRLGVMSRFETVLVAPDIDEPEPANKPEST